jgi:type I restriction enzyme R subunit
LYSYITQISSFGEVEWEKSFVFLRFLNKKLPKGKNEKVSVLDYVDLDSLRIQMVGESSLSLVDKVGELQPNYGGGGKQMEDEKELLSEIIEKINNLYGIEIGDDDKVSLDKVLSRVTTNEEMSKVMKGKNTDDDKLEFFRDLFREEMVDYYGVKMEFYRKIMDKRILPMVVESMYRSFSKSFGG